MKKLLLAALVLSGLITPLASAGDLSLKVGGKIPNLKMNDGYSIIDSGIMSSMDKNGETNSYRIVTLKSPSGSKIFITYPVCYSKTTKITPFGFYIEGDKKFYLNYKPYDYDGIIDEALDVEGMNMVDYVPKCIIGKFA